MKETVSSKSNIILAVLRTKANCDGLDMLASEILIVKFTEVMKCCSKDDI